MRQFSTKAARKEARRVWRKCRSIERKRLNNGQPCIVNGVYRANP